MKKRILCMALSMSLVVSSIITGNTTSEAKTKVKLSSKTVRITQGETKKITVKNAKKATYQWKLSSKKKVKITKGSKKASVSIKGLKKGSATLTCKVKQKGKKTISLKAKIKVRGKTIATSVPTAKSTAASISSASPSVQASIAPSAKPSNQPSAEPSVQPSAEPSAQPSEEPTAPPEDYSMTKAVAIDKDSNASSAVTPNEDGTSSVTFSGNYSTVLIPVGSEDCYDLSDYTTLILDLNTEAEIRVSLFDSKGNNLKSPTSGTAEWSQWDYINGDKKHEIDITPISREEVGYIALSSCNEVAPLLLRGIQFYANDYRLSFDAQIAKDSEGSANVTSNEDGTSNVNFTAQYANINIPLGDADSYNLSQYTKLSLDICCAEEFRVTLCNSKGVNIQPASSGTAEWSQWWYVGSNGTDGKVECDLSAFKKEDLADVAYVTLCANQEALKPVTLKGLTFSGDARIEKFIPATEESGPQDPNTENLKLTRSFSEINGTLMNNPLITQDYTADPTSIEYNGRLYVFATNDVVEFDSKGIPVSNAYNTHTIRIISSSDLVNWRDEGNIDVTELTDYATKSWAPTVCSKEIDGTMKFFLYYTTGGNGIAVLEADSPTGPWTDPIGKTLVNHDTPTCSESEVPWCFDPSVLVDDDGTGYLYFGGGPDSTSGKETNQEHPKSARVVQLGDDMTSLNDDPVEMDAKWYFEDNEINKIGDTYYYSYCTNWSVKDDDTTSSCCIAYMTSKNPMTGWTYQGQLFANPGSVFGNYYNNHHRMTQFKNEWYLLYHTTLLEEAQYGTKKGYRSLHIDKLNWTDGIPSATATYESVTPVGTLNPYETVNATEMAWNGGLSTTSTTTGMVLSSIDTGDWFGINNIDFGTDKAKSVQLSIAGTTTEGFVEVYLDAPSTSEGGTNIAKVELTDTGSLDAYKTIKTNLSSEATGKHKVFFVLRGVGYQIANWKFEK